MELTRRRVPALIAYEQEGGGSGAPEGVDPAHWRLVVQVGVCEWRGVALAGWHGGRGATAGHCIQAVCLVVRWACSNAAGVLCHSRSPFVLRAHPIEEL